MSAYQLGDRVKFTGTVKKEHGYESGYTIRYADAPPPGFIGYAMVPDSPAHSWEETQHPRTEGIIIGKRRYASMQNDEGIWIPDGVQVFDAYLVAWHMRRNPVIVRGDQIESPKPEGGTP